MTCRSLERRCQPLQLANHVRGLGSSNSPQPVPADAADENPDGAGGRVLSVEASILRTPVVTSDVLGATQMTKEAL